MKNAIQPPATSQRFPILPQPATDHHGFVVEEGVVEVIAEAWADQEGRVIDEALWIITSHGEILHRAPTHGQSIADLVDFYRIHGQTTGEEIFFRKA